MTALSYILQIKRQNKIFFPYIVSVGYAIRTAGRGTHAVKFFLFSEACTLRFRGTVFFFLSRDTN